MKRLIYSLLFLMCFTISGNTQEVEPNFETIYKREIPQWFNQDKFEIFVVWGPYSVPSYKVDGYAEWYWNDSGGKDEKTTAFHKKVYGKEFAFHQSISQRLNVDIYFAKPYHSWERGANENTNGLIRQYFPKGTSFETITDKDIEYVQNKLNNRPGKKLNYLSPNEFYLTKFTNQSVS